MHEMGIVRKLDKLGRIVFPIEVRDNLGIKPGDGLEIFVNGEQIILKKYAPGCVFCDSISGIVEYKGKRICTSCLEDIENNK
ncbi:AbrB/MazE/SpoVT family DNA-binding domain-containing protein [Aneurinibacillus migulanus]|uniref:AbrB/MazE/SpoVT family DNA-binding domain-containing protein n=1 Tax=Aneurinibacillus migulanus TaxID=47500 RepID=UPI00209CCBFA|nr:AbrB/MazE/SpoVT family DNA-binding domain-containing protein [Aneurinibacillus migulanus]MCP1357916.1 AbrB/MazE/SpoVT family DNA-binding domain-containing protein [Aneurinibacillus migulanus]